MKRILILALILVLIQSFNFVYADVWVDPYIREDGTHVRGHYRSDPDGNPYNNWSFPGNRNPYTGEIATGSVEAYLRNYYDRDNSSYSMTHDAARDYIYSRFRVYDTYDWTYGDFISLQGRLSLLGYYTSSISGLPSVELISAVENYQNDYGINVSGFADDETIAAIDDTLTSFGTNLSVQDYRPEAYFTLNSTVSEVVATIGDQYYHNWKDEKITLGDSVVYFEDGKVSGWKNEGELKVWIASPIPGYSFSYGDTFEDVIAAMGTPTEYRRGLMKYGMFSEVRINEWDNRRVYGWKNFQNELNVFVCNPIEGIGFTIGSTLQDVFRAIGTPDQLDYSSIYHNGASIGFDYMDNVDGWYDLYEVLPIIPSGFWGSNRAYDSSLRLFVEEEKETETIIEEEGNPFEVDIPLFMIHVDKV